ncbi:hypothetical protein WJ87_09405 [Burkholderia ubonensis]|nr:hypothetical protein WJ87_09405 [Burkholderia ubonensis]
MTSWFWSSRNDERGRLRGGAFAVFAALAPLAGEAATAEAPDAAAADAVVFRGAINSDSRCRAIGMS